MIEDRDIIIENPNCKKVALPIARPKTICKNCGKKYKWHELQNKWQKTFISCQNESKDNSDCIFESCVNCATRSMIFYKKLDIWVCFDCGSGWKMHEISKCEACQLYTDDPIESLCSDCWNEGFGELIVSSKTNESHQFQ